jgi:C4-dicarboxylate-specific signal transduction histidine kinase
VRIVPHVVVAVLAFLVGLGVGYWQWGSQAVTLAEDLRVARAECEQRVSDAERRARAAEDRVQQEIRARRVVEDALHQVSPQK